MEGACVMGRRIATLREIFKKGRGSKDNFNAYEVDAA